MNSTFLALPGEHERRAAPVSPTATPTAVVPPVTAAPVAALPTAVREAAADAGAARTAKLEAEVRRLHEELAAAASRTPVPAAAVTVPVVTVRDIEPLREQLQQTLAALETLQRRVEATGAPADSTADESSSLVSSQTLFLLLVGLLAGWIGHTLYGRTSDRGYRSRIRF